MTDPADNFSTSYRKLYLLSALATTFLALASLLFPKEPLKIFPFLVFLSPLPMLKRICK